MVELSTMAKAAGLDPLQVECTPLSREIPHTVEQGRKFLKDLEGRCGSFGETSGQYRPCLVSTVARSGR
jgi:hypothetical protein